MYTYALGKRGHSHTHSSCALGIMQARLRCTGGLRFVPIRFYKVHVGVKSDGGDNLPLFKIHMSSFSVRIVLFDHRRSE
jgi:hypothetical protein